MPSVARKSFGYEKKEKLITFRNMDDNQFSKESVGKRLRLIRERLGLGKQDELGPMLGADAKRYNNWELGVAMFPVNFAAKLCSLASVDLDYIYRGDLSGLPVKTIKLLADSPAKAAPATLSRRRQGS